MAAIGGEGTVISGRAFSTVVIGLAVFAAAPLLLAYEIPADYETALIKDHTPQRMTALWQEAVAGINLALGKTATYRPKPDRAYCTEAGDPSQLTDGVTLYPSDAGLTSTQIFNKLRYDPQAVGWDAIHTPAHIMIDLGALQPVGRVVARCQGGLPMISDFPTRITVLVSEDGQAFYRVGEWVNLPGSRSGPFACCRMPHLGDTAVIFPFVFGELTTKARYVGLEITQNGDLCLDEIAVIGGQFDPAGVTYNEADRRPFSTTGAAVLPREGVLELASNATLFQNLPAYNDLSAAGVEVTWILELPAGVELCDAVHRRDPKPDYRTAADQLYVPFYDQVSAVIRNGQPYTRYAFKYGGPYDGGPKKRPTYRVGPLFFEPCTVPPPGPAYVFATWSGGSQPPNAVPISVYELPEARPLRRLHASLGWMPDFVSIPWPDYASNYRACGFNVHPTFPRYWDRGLAGYQGAAATMEMARAAGLQILYNESPWGWGLRPAQRDAAYQAELDRLSSRAGLTNPDWVFHDVENLPNPNTSDPEFVARMQQEGLDPAKTADQQEMLLRLGTETYADMYAAVVDGMAAAGHPASPEAGRPLVGSFAFDAAEGVQYWFDYNRLYPHSLQHSMPSYYVAGNSELLAERLFRVRGIQGSSDVIPWLSTGCDGEFPSGQVRDQALEAFFTGSRGLTYYSATYVDGQDLREHLEAVNVAAQVEDLIMDGDVIGYDRVASVGSAVWVKGLASGDEMAVLASNYRGYRAVPRPEVVVPGPALRADFRSSVAAQAFGVAYNIAGGWTFDGQTAMAADANTYVRYKTTTADGMAAAMPSGSDWVVRLTYRETDAGSTQQLFTLGSGILRLHCLAGSRRLMCYPATALVEVPPSPGDWHEIAVHYRAATSRIDLYVDGLLRLADMRSEMNIYALSAIELRGPASFGDVRAGSLDPRSTPGSASPEGPSSVVLSLEVGGPSDVIDLDTRGFVGSVSPVANEVQVALDRTVRAFHVRPPVWADLHHDADVDADDFAAFWACVSGPGLPAVPEPPCPQADLDGDGDVDQEDFGLFQRCYSGPGIAPDCR